MKDLRSITSDENFLMNCYKGVSAVEGEKRIKKVEEVRATLSDLEELHEEISKGFNKKINRREYLKAVGTMAAGTYGASVGHNIWSQTSNDQFSHFEIVGSRHSLSIEKAVKGDEVKVDMVQLRAPEIQNADYDWGKVFDTVSEVFEQDLDIKVDLEYHTLDLIPEKLIADKENIRTSDVSYEEFFEFRKGAIKRLERSIIKGDPTGGLDPEVEQDVGDSNTSTEVINGLLSLRTFRDNYARNSRIKVLVSSFDGSGGVSTTHGSEDNDYVVMDKGRSQESFTDVLTHEIAHKFGLPHTIKSQDIMSYSAGRIMARRVRGRPHFSVESKFNWSRIKRNK